MMAALAQHGIWFSFFFGLHLQYTVENKSQKAFTKIGVEWDQAAGTATSTVPAERASAAGSSRLTGEIADFQNSLLDGI